MSEIRALFNYFSTIVRAHRADLFLLPNCSMAEALLEREISRLKKKIQEKDDRIHALELISSDAAHPPSSSRPDAIANIPPPDLESGLSKLRSGKASAFINIEAHRVSVIHFYLFFCSPSMCDMC